MKVYKLSAILFCLLLKVNYSIGQSFQNVDVGAGNFQLGEKSFEMSPFEITKYEITNKQYARFLNSRSVGADGIYKTMKLINAGSDELQLVFDGTKWQVKPDKESYPMVMVSYYGANEFCKWAGARLPTEAQWKYAASGGGKSKHYTYAGGDDLDKVAWYKSNSGQHAHSVGEKEPNELGIYDMCGNVWEWCLNDSLRSDTDFCVHMGGSWYATGQAASLDAHYGNVPTHFSNSVGFRAVFPVEDLPNKSTLKDYKGKPWNDHIQQVPGKLQCEWYDSGGEGISYHDNDSINNGSGKLNPADGSFLNEFRMHEGVDISYTKSRQIDDNPHNKVEPAMDQLYVGWTEPGEWINYTINVKRTGTYSIDLMYTASGDGSIALWLDGKRLTNELLIPSTRSDKETIAWRQWHHWNRIDGMAYVNLKKGIHILTLETLTNGNMNYDFLEFKMEKK
jgi:hypothetical protein